MLYASTTIATSALHVNNPVETPSHDESRTPTTPLTAAEPRASPLSYIANSSARRRREKVVLQSPARRGHSVCIRKIFSDQQQQQQRQRNVIYQGYDKDSRDLSYPLLPNISNVSRQLQPRSNPHMSPTGTLKSDRTSLYNQTPSLFDNALTYREPVSITESMDREQITDNWSEDENATTMKEVQEGFYDADLNVAGAKSLSHAAAEDDFQNACTSDKYQFKGGQGIKLVSTTQSNLGTNTAAESSRT